MNSQFLYSQMSFNERVLEQGRVTKGRSYSASELKQLMFFNDVFTSNCDELFEKYDMLSNVITQYIGCMQMYSLNLKGIVDCLKYQYGINISHQGSFESRWTTVMRAKQYAITTYHDPRLGIQFPFENGRMYFICRWNDRLAITTFDPNTSVFESPISCNYSDGTVYWKTDECLMDMVKSMFDTESVLGVSVIRHKEAPHTITKVHYIGDQKLLDEIRPLFGYKSIMIHNWTLYTDDIKQIIKSLIPKKEVIEYQQSFRFIDLKGLSDIDFLVEYPSESFDSYLQFLSNAAQSTSVSEMYLTLYRIGNNPSIYYILRNAIQNGIKVHVNIELHASGEEELNKSWLYEFKRIGINVSTYKSGELKVHSKLTLIKFNDGIMVAQIGTGNYHTDTTSQYTDLSLTTGDQNICSQVLNLFKMFETNLPCSFDDNLLVTQFNCRSTLIDLIDIESNKGSNGYICFKCNALDDELIKYHLDQAAENGCRIDLIIRGVCTWVPKELNKNVTIRSFIWDKLEHSRVYSFGKVNPIVYIGSLDLVTKKIDKRIETLVKINDPEIGIDVCSYLNRYMTNHDMKSWKMTNDGKYVKEAIGSDGI